MSLPPEDNAKLKKLAVQPGFLLRRFRSGTPDATSYIQCARFSLMSALPNAVTQQQRLQHQKAIARHWDDASAQASAGGCLVVASLSAFFEQCLVPSLKLSKGSEVVVVGFPSSTSALSACARSGAVLNAVPSQNGGAVDAAVFRKTLSSKTKIVVLGSLFGRPMPRLMELRAIARERGVPVLLDATDLWLQRSRSALVDLDCDIVCASMSLRNQPSLVGASCVVLVKDAKLLEAFQKMESKKPELGKPWQVAQGFHAIGTKVVSDPVSCGLVHNLTPISNLAAGLLPQSPVANCRVSTATLMFAQLALTTSGRDSTPSALETVRSKSGWQIATQLPPYVQVLSTGDPDRPKESTFWKFALFCRSPREFKLILDANGFECFTRECTHIPQSKHILLLPISPQMNDKARVRLIRLIWEVPSSVAASPDESFHRLVSERAALPCSVAPVASKAAAKKMPHAYRSAQLAQYLKSTPRFTEGISGLINVVGGPIAGPIVGAIVSRL